MPGKALDLGVDFQNGEIDLNEDQEEGKPRDGLRLTTAREDFLTFSST